MRSPEAWPNGSRGAVVVNIMYEQWDPGVAPGLGPMGNPLPAGFLDHQAVSWADYGWRTGVWEVLSLLERERVPATFYVSGILTQSAPDSVSAIVSGGHELAGHSWAQNRIPALGDRAEEGREISRCVRALESVGGQRPRGWISPRCTPSAFTASLLADVGFDWFGDVFDADLPYWLTTDAGRIVALPFGLEVNDLPMNVRYGQPTRELVSAFAFLAKGMSASRNPGFVDVTLHAHVGCRPAGLLALSEIIDTARRHDMWIATRSDIVDHFVSAGEAYTAGGS
ncbi:MAG: polysaccharide deacetylase family protein [Ornithinimicrobium sp.]